MQEAINQFNRESSPAEEVFWFAIDENTHGAVSVFPSEESYKKIKQKLENMREEASSNITLP